MVTRIVTALVAIPIGILIIALNNEILYYVAMTAFSVIAVYELSLIHISEPTRRS